MSYKIVAPFGRQESKGTFDDFFSTKKYNSLQEAYLNEDYVECDFVQDDAGVLYIECKNVKDPENKKYHRLMIQKPVFGLDMMDDYAAVELAQTLL